MPTNSVLACVSVNLIFYDLNKATANKITRSYKIKNGGA